MIMSRRTAPLQRRFAGKPAERSEEARPDRAAREAMKAQRDQDAGLAMEEYEAGRRAVVANAERLRALRLARESEQALGKSAKTPKKGVQK